MDFHHEEKLRPHVSRTGAWAFALGTSIGWGSLVVTANTYLSQAGPLGSVLGMVLGAVIMLAISRNYAYMMDCYPESGGAYSFSRSVFGYDHGFLTAWFLGLTYLAILWANATALPLFARYFLGDLFRVGYLYRIFGYEVYLGEAALSVLFMLAAAYLCARSPKISAALMIGMVLLFSAGIGACFLWVFLRGGSIGAPTFVPDSSAMSQVIRIAVISPWAFIGFESISHGVEEYSFPRRDSFRVLVTAVITSAALYIIVTLLSVTAYPEGYGSWLEYIQDLNHLSGIEALPAFFAARHYMGDTGVWILMASLLCLILTSLIGNITALSRLLYALGKDEVLPASAGRLSRNGAPARAVMLTAAASCLIPFLGRTAIGWIVDVTTLGATLIYGFVSAAAWRTAKFRNDRRERLTGLAGLILMICFGIYLLVPNLFTAGSMEPESYFLFVAWSVTGFFVFRHILKKDGKKRFGKSIVVWIALLSLILFVSMVWMNQSILGTTNKALYAIEEIYREGGAGNAQSELISREMAGIRMVSARSISVVILVFAMSLGILVQNYRLMSQQADRSSRELELVRDMAGKDPLTGVRSKLAYGEAEKELNGEIEEAAREPFAVAVLDVNGLKAVNDTLGHQAGDEYLKKASRMICMYFAHSPVFRTGGDEFVCILQGSDYEQRAEIMNLFRKEAEAHISSGDVVISAGCSDYRPGEDRSLKDVFQRSDAAMYENKMWLKSLGAVTRQ